TRVHAPNVRPERTAITVRVHPCVSEVVVTPHIGAKAWVVFVRCEDERSAAPPSPHQLGGYQLLLFRCLAMLTEKVAECTDTLVHPEVGDIAAVAGKDLGLWESRGQTVLVGIAKKEFTSLNRRA